MGDKQASSILSIEIVKCRVLAGVHTSVEALDKVCGVL
jgi:hypothetical protein